MIGDLPPDEQAIIDEAVYDCIGWVVDRNLPEERIEALSAKGVIRLWRGRWQLTPLGYGRTARSRSMSTSPLSGGDVVPSS